MEVVVFIILLICAIFAVIPTGVLLTVALVIALLVGLGVLVVKWLDSQPYNGDE